MTIEIRSSAVKEAIARSISHNEIVTLMMSDVVTGDDEARAEWDHQAYRDALREAAMDAAAVHGDDSVANGDVVEMWGTDEDGDDFRVHFSLGRG